jgi:ABC-type amino acid transport substrate-binding protein
VGARFGTLLAAMYTLVLAVLGASAVAGLCKVSWTKLLRHGAISILLTILVIGGIRFFFQSVVGQEYQEDRAFTSLDMQGKYPSATVHRSSIPAPPAHDPQKSRLSEVRERGFLRLGYFADAMPFAFENKAGKLVGLDVELAHQLAQDLNVKLEFVRIVRGESAAMLNGGQADVVMSGLHIMLERTGEITYSVPYMNETLAFIVKDHRREDFASADKVRELIAPRIGIPNAAYLVSRVSRYLPNAQLTLLDSPADFFGPKGASLDAMLYTAEAGSVWTLIHPAYSVAIPRPRILSLPLAYGVAHGESEFATYLSTWIDLKKNDGTIQGLYDRWVLGRNVADREPRWSVIRNVLHWVE